MAPRGSVPVRASFSSAAHHAREAINHWGNGVFHSAQQLENGVRARGQEHRAAWPQNPNAGYEAYNAAQRYRQSQSNCRYNANQAFGNAASHASKFAHHAGQGIRNAARATRSWISDFDPHKMVSGAARYGRKVARQAEDLARSSISGLGHVLDVAWGASMYTADLAMNAAGHSLPNVSRYVRDVADQFRERLDEFRYGVQNYNPYFQTSQYQHPLYQHPQYL